MICAQKVYLYEKLLIFIYSILAEELLIFIYFILAEESSKEIVKKAAQSVGSLSDTEFNITFNTDVFQPHVKHVLSEVCII